MDKILQKKFLLSPQGAKNMKKGIIYSALLNIAFMLPMCTVFNFIKESLDIYMYHRAESYNITLYIIMVPLTFIVMFFVNKLQYDNVYTTTYTETANKRVGLSEHMRKLPLSFFERRNLADLTATIMGDMEAIEHAYSHSVPQFYGMIISVVVIAVLIGIVSPVIAIALIWPFPIALILINLARNHKYKVETGHYESKRRVTEAVQEIIDNILPIKGSNRIEKTFNEFKALLDEEEKKHIKAEFLNPLLLGPINIFLRLGILTAIFIGSLEYSKGNVDLAYYITVIIACSLIYTPMEACMAFIMEFMYVRVPAERMNEISTIKLMSGEKVKIDNFTINAEKISFGYEDEKVIENMSFTVPQGKITALVGPSGCGKSTLTRLMLRFWDVDEGRITLGGKDIKTIDPENLLTHFSMVFQDVILFNNTVMENIRIGKKDATDQEVIAAAKAAQVEDFVKDLPEKYNTRIGENGVLLSGGERQRISIARAILKNSPIIFLDESTSSIDAENETKVQEALSKLIKDKTVVVIAHRLRTVEKADKIVVIEKGQLVEEGTAKELIENKGLF